MRYALHIFPQFADMNEIQCVRAKYDPLCELIPPHITLVFPFEAEEAVLEAAMKRARQVLRNTTPFVAETAQTVCDEEILMLLIERGKAEIACLHDELYKKAFAKWFAPEYEYMPHITLGRGKVLPADLLISKHVCTVRQAVLERIDKEERSEILEIIRFEGGYEL